MTKTTTAPEDLELAALARAGDREAREALWRRWQYCARAAATRYLRLRPSYARHREDLEAEAALAIWTAIPRFEPDRGRTLSTYLIQWAYYALLDYADGALAPGGVHVPKYLRRRRGRDEGPICWEAGAADRDDLLGSIEARPEAPAAADVPSLAGLDDRSRAVLRLWHGLDPVPGLADAAARTAARPSALIARHLGLSRERVRQIHAAAVARLRAEAGCCEKSTRPA